MASITSSTTKSPFHWMSFQEGTNQVAYLEHTMAPENKTDNEIAHIFDAIVNDNMGLLPHENEIVKRHGEYMLTMMVERKMPQSFVNMFSLSPTITDDLAMGASMKVFCNLRECGCKTLRRNSPHSLRVDYENAVISRIIDHTKKTRGIVRGTFFATAYLLGEFVLLVKLINEIVKLKIQTQFEFNFIDHKYRVEEEFTPHGIVSNLREQLTKEIGDRAKGLQERIEELAGKTKVKLQFQSLKPEMFNPHLPFVFPAIQDFIALSQRALSYCSAVKSTLPPVSSLKIRFFDSDQSYIYAFRKDGKLKSDFLVGADIDGAVASVETIRTELDLERGRTVILLKRPPQTPGTDRDWASLQVS